MAEPVVYILPPAVQSMIAEWRAQQRALESQINGALSCFLAIEKAEGQYRLSDDGTSCIPVLSKAEE